MQVYLIKSCGRYENSTNLSIVLALDKGLEQMVVFANQHKPYDETPDASLEDIKENEWASIDGVPIFHTRMRPSWTLSIEDTEEWIRMERWEVVE
jgi:hypothetical protein